MGWEGMNSCQIVGKSMIIGYVHSPKNFPTRYLPIANPKLRDILQIIGLYFSESSRAWKTNTEEVSQTKGAKER